MHLRRRRQAGAKFGLRTLPAAKHWRGTMAQFSVRAPAQSSSFNTVVVGIFTGAMIALAGLLSFAPYTL